MREALGRLFAALERGRRFVAHDIWQVGRPHEAIPRGLIIKQIRVVILLLQNLVRDALLLRAAALAFATIFAIVPFLAIVYFIITTFNLGEDLFNRLPNRFGLSQHTATALPIPQSTTLPSPDGTDVADEAPPVPEPPSLLAAAKSSEERNRILWDQFIAILFQNVGQNSQAPDGGQELENTVQTVVASAVRGADAKSLGIPGIIFVIWAVFSLMDNVESAFNSIWGVRRTRPWYRILGDYFIITLLLPFLTSAVLAVSVILQSRLGVNWFGRFAYGVQAIQFVAIALGFAAMYRFVPNTRVRSRYALFAGVVSGALWLLASWAYVKFQFGLVNYNLFYATFAQIPLLLMWVYVSWLVLLFGAELCFACQNEKTFAIERLADGASHAYREALGLCAMIDIGRRFDEGQPGLDVGAAAEEWNVPTRLLNTTLEQLDAAGLVRPSAADRVTYYPGRSLDKITVGNVVTALREAGQEPSALREDEALRPLLESMFDMQHGRMGDSIAAVVKELRHTLTVTEASARQAASGQIADRGETL